MIDLLRTFLDRRLDPQKPLLLALSGGPDSVALFHLLISYGKASPLKLAVAHIDHGWRPESGDEAEGVRRLAEAHEVPFHLKKLDPSSLKGNLEEACRRERLAFFRSLSDAHGYQAVLTAHHADDHAETVLKRVLEGASLHKLAALKESHVVDGVTLWRPLLGIQKSQLLLWLEEQNLPFYTDSTNADPRFLRGRMRSSILPELSRQFGKEVNSSLSRLGREAAEWSDYLLIKTAPYITYIEKGGWGVFLDAEPLMGLHALERSFIVSQFCDEADFPLNRVFRESIEGFLQDNAADKKLIAGYKTLYIDRRRLFVPTWPLEGSSDSIPLKEGFTTWGEWEVVVERVQKGCTVKPTNWKDAWRGECRVVLPAGKYVLGPAKANAPYPGNGPLADWWTKAKVPAFFRYSIPVVWSGDTVSHEFLTGRGSQHDGLVSVMLKLRSHP